MELTVKVIGKDIVSDKGNFTAFSLLTSKGNWYKTAKAEPKELAKVNGKIVTVVVSRKFDKTVMVRGEERQLPSLVIEEIKSPTAEELTKYETELQKLNDETLENVE